MNNQKIVANNDLVTKLGTQASEINSKISFETYLIKSGYTPLSQRLFLKENPLEIIRLSKKNGQTIYQNFGDNRDMGTLIDFIFNRTKLSNGIANGTTSNALAETISTANTFLKRHPKQRIMPRELKEMALQATRCKI